MLVGALMYLAVATRPDLAHSVGVLARFSANPGPAHWAALKHLCRYVQGTKCEAQRQSRMQAIDLQHT